MTTTTVAVYRKALGARTRRLLRVALACCAVVGAALLLVAMRQPLDHSALLGALLLLAVPAVAFLVSKLPGSGAPVLEFDDEGMTYAFLSPKRPRRWRWQELSAFELLDRRSDPRPGTGFIRFTVPRDRRLPGYLRLRAVILPERVEVRIHDSCDMPLADLAAQLNRYRERSLDAVMAVLEGTPDLSVKAKASSYPAPLVYHVDFERGESVVWPLPLIAVLALIVVTNLLQGSVWPAVLGIGGCLLFFAAWLLSYKAFAGRPPKDNFLRLDDIGLTHRSHGVSRTWPWRELSEITLHGGGPIWPKVFGRFVTARIPDDGARPRLLQRLCRLWFRRPTLVIADLYLAPLEEIAAKLEEYRTRALAGAPGRRRDAP